MRVIQIEQNSEAWFEYRLGKVTGSKAKDVAPKANGAGKRDGFWHLLAEKVAERPDGEPDDDRGHRLENVALAEFSMRTRIPVNTEPGMWVSDDDDDIAVSPDGVVDNGNPIPNLACEVKCLSSAKHLKYVITHLRAIKNDKKYTPFKYVPSEFRAQLVQYFVVNDDLEKVYFIFFDDRVSIERLSLHFIEIRRTAISDLIDNQKNMQLETLDEVNGLIADVVEGRI